MKKQYNIKVFDKTTNNYTLEFDLKETRAGYRLYNTYNLLNFNNNSSNFKNLKKLIKKYAMYMINTGLYDDIAETDRLIIEFQVVEG